MYLRNHNNNHHHASYHKRISPYAHTVFFFHFTISQFPPLLTPLLFLPLLIRERTLPSNAHVYETTYTHTLTDYHILFLNHLSILILFFINHLPVLILFFIDNLHFFRRVLLVVFRPRCTLSCSPFCRHHDGPLRRPRGARSCYQPLRALG